MQSIQSTSIIEEFSQQYFAALKMTEDVIVHCNEKYWQDYTHEVIINQLVYHILGSMDLSLSKTNDERSSFKERYGKFDFPFNNQSRNFTKQQMTDYLNEIKEKANKLFKSVTLEEFSTKTIFDYRGTLSLYSVLENNLRHSMLHIGALHARLNILDKKDYAYVNVIYGDERDTNNELNNQGVAYILEGKLDEAENIYTKLCNEPVNPLYYYNFSCVQSRKGYKEKALETLKLCLKFDNGNLFKNLAKTDTDFTNIRELPAFQQIIG